MKYYKVVGRLPNGWRVSAGALPARLRIGYLPKRWTRSQFKYGKLFVFDHENQARSNYEHFVLSYLDDIKNLVALELWEVDVINPTPITSAYKVWDITVTSSGFQRFISRYWKYGKSNDTGTVSRHVCTADAVKLKKLLASKNL